MYTQVELVSTDDVYVYWLNNDTSVQPKLRVGHGVRILEVPGHLRVNRVFTTLKNLSELPTKRCIGTIVEIN
jgi:hypothetical protein